MSDSPISDLSIDLDAAAFARVLEAGGDALVIFDPEWRYVYINAAALPLLGRPRDKLIGCKMTDVFPEITRTPFWEMYTQAVRERAFLTIEDYFAPLDAWFDIRALPHGDLLYVHFRDVTARKRAEQISRDTQQQLREAQSRLETALSAGEIATWTFDVVNDRVTADGNLSRLFSVSDEDAAGGRLEIYLQAIHPEDRPRVTHAIGMALQSGDQFESEYRVVLPDGSERWLSARGKVERNPDGVPVSLPGVVLDITERKQAEEALRVSTEALREQGEYLRRVVESSPDCLKTLDLEGNVVSMTDSGKRVLQVDDFSTICGANWLTFWEDEETRRAVGAALDMARAGGVGRFHGFCPTLKGEPRWWDVAIVPIFGADGKPEQLLGVSRDVTERELQYAQEHLRAERETVLARIGAVVRSSLPPLEVQTVADEMLGRSLKVDRCYYVTIDSAGDRMTIGGDYHAENLPSLAGVYRVSDFDLDVGDIFGGGKTIAVRDTLDTDATPWGDKAAAVLAGMRVRSLVNVPFHNERGELIAALGVAMAETPREWTAEEVAFVEQVATETREAVAAVRRHERERNISQQLQAALQPPPPSDLPGLALESFYRPALDEAGVGGDGFDVFQVEKNCSALCVFDLSGKGLSAAAAVATVRNMMRFALYNSPSVAQALTTLNQTLVQHDLIQGFATLFLGVYDHGAGTIRYVNCGQEPGLIWRAATGEVEQMDPTGPVLGGFEGGVFIERMVTLRPGDVIALFTDGLTEVGATSKTLLEIDGVSSILRACCGDSRQTNTPKFVVDSLIAGVDRFASGGARDDIALLVGVAGAGAAVTRDRT